MAGRAGGLVAALTVGPVLDQFQVVVAEEPEELFRLRQRGRVLIRLERAGAAADHRRQPAEHRRVQRLTDGRLRGQAGRRAPGHTRRAVSGQVTGRGEGEHEPAGVEYLDRQPAADLELGWVERHVDAEPAAGRPVPHRVAAMAP